MTKSSHHLDDEYKNLFEEAKASLLHITNLSTTILDCITEAIIVTDQLYNIVRCNKATKNVFGLPGEEILGKNLFTTIHLSEDVTLKEAAAKVIVSHESQAIDYYYKHPSSRKMYLETKIHPLSEAGGKESGLIFVTDDISRRMQVENALRESESQYRLLVENITDVIWTMDLDLHYTYISPSVIQLRGYSIEEAMEQTLEDILTPNSFEIAKKALEEEMEIEKQISRDITRTKTLELEQKCKNGTTIWTEVKMTFLRDPDGHPRGILGATRDITERRQIETLQTTLFRTKDYLELRRMLDERLAEQVGLVVIYAGNSGPNALFNKSSLSEQEVFNLTYRGFTVLMSGINYRNQLKTKYAGTIEIPDSDFFALGFYRAISGFPEEIEQDSRLESTVIMLMLVMRKQIMAYMLQKFLQIEEFLAETTQSWDQLINLTKIEFEIFHERIREFMLKATKDEREKLLEELAKELIDIPRITKDPEFALPEEVIGMRPD